METHSDPYYISMLGISLIMLVASGVYLFAQRVKLVPFPVLLLVIGLILRPIYTPVFDAMRITPGMVMFIFLPILLFESAFHFEFREFRKILSPALLLATVGLGISSIVIALPLWLIFDLPFFAAWLYGSVISSTDPIAVLSIFKRLGVPKKLQLLIDAESFVNDGTSVILFRVLTGLQAGLVGTTFAGEIVFNSIGSFVYVLLGGVLTGALLGWLFSQLIAPIKNETTIETTLTIILAPLVFIIADHVLIVSGIIAVLTAGLVIGNYGRIKISPSVLSTMTHTWEFLAFWAVSIVFLLIGYEVDFQSLIRDLPEILVALLALLAGRAVAVYGLGFLYNQGVPKRDKYPLSWWHIANVGGLRGALPLVLFLSLADSYAYKSLFINMTLGSILFTMLVNALATTPLIKKFGLDKATRSTTIETEVMEALILMQVLDRLDKLKAIGEIHQSVYEARKQDMEQELAQTKKQIQEWVSEKTDEEYTEEIGRVLKRFTLQTEHSVYHGLYRRGIIDEGIYISLKNAVDFQLDGFNEENGRPVLIPSDPSDIHRDIDRVLEDRFSVSNWIQALLGKSYRQQIRDYYLYHFARLSGDRKVIEELQKLDSLGIPEFSSFIIGVLVNEYTQLSLHNQRTLDEVAKKFPSDIETLEEKLFEIESEEVLHTLIKTFGEEQRISPKALEMLHHRRDQSWTSSLDSMTVRERSIA